MINRILVAWCFLLTGNILFAQENQFSLSQAQEYALANGYVARIQKMEVDVADKQVAEVIGRGFPQINVSGDFQHFIDVPVQVIPDFISPVIEGNLINYGIIDAEDVPNGTERFIAAQFGTNYQVNASLRVDQLIFNGSYFVGLQAAKTVRELSNNVYEKSQADIRAMVAKAYHTVLVSERNLEILEENLVTLSKTHDDTRALYDAGFVEEQDVDQLRLNLLNLQVSIDNARLQVDLARKMLKFQIGLKVNDDIVLTDNLEQLVLLASNENLLNRQALLESHPDQKLANTQLVVAQLELKNEKVQYWPTLNGFFSHGQGAFRNEFNFFEKEPWFPSTIWGINLNIPIFSGMSRWNRVQQMKIALEQEQISLDETRERLILEADQARSNYEVALKTFHNQVENIALAQRILDKENAKFKEGISSSTDLNIAQTQFLQAQNSYAISSLELLNSKIDLDNAINNFE